MHKTLVIKYRSNQLSSLPPTTHISNPPPAFAVLAHWSQVLVLSCAPETVEMSELSKFGVEIAAFVSTLRFPETQNDYVEFPKYLIQQPYVFLSDPTKRILTI